MNGHPRSFLIRHWQGRVALLPTLLITLLGLRLGLSWLSRLRPADWPLALFATASLLSAALLAWQVIGSLRAVKRSGGGLGLAAGLAAVTISILLFITSELDGYASRAADVAGLPPVVPLPVSGKTVLVEGPLDWPYYARFCAALNQHPELETVSLASDGGFVPVARAMAARIAELGLDTRADGLCASACTLVFMAGHSRSLGPDGALGFHGYTLHRQDPMQTAAEEEARDRAWLAGRGVAADFIASAFATPKNTLWQPDEATLRAAGVLASPDDPPGSAADTPNCGYPVGKGALSQD